MVDEPYDLVWTPEFSEDLFLAVDYIQNYLKIPVAARELYDDITGKLEKQRYTPTIAVARKGMRGQTFYCVNHGRYNAYYVIENRTIKIIGLKHQLQY